MGSQLIVSLANENHVPFLQLLPLLIRNFSFNHGSHVFSCLLKVQ